MSYKMAPPTQAPVNKRNKLVVYVIIVIIFCTSMWYFALAPYLEKFEKVERPENYNQVIGDLLLPGYHMVDKWPFLITIPHNHSGSLLDQGWYYDVEIVIIPPGHVGVLSEGKGTQHNPLKPGRYYIDPRQYEVTLKDK